MEERTAKEIGKFKRGEIYKDMFGTHDCIGLESIIDKILVFFILSTIVHHTKRV